MSRNYEIVSRNYDLIFFNMTLIGFRSFSSKTNFFFSERKKSLARECLNASSFILELVTVVPLICYIPFVFAFFIFNMCTTYFSFKCLIKHTETVNVKEGRNERKK